MASSVELNEAKFKQFNMLEKYRVESFEVWPYDQNQACSVVKMAEAGFYWSGNVQEVDTATCFVCKKTLDGWEANDDPWKEHLKHAPQCEFVKYGCDEKDLTVEQFLKLLGIVVKTEIRAEVARRATEVEKRCQKQLDQFLN